MARVEQIIRREWKPRPCAFPWGQSKFSLTKFIQGCYIGTKKNTKQTYIISLFLSSLLANWTLDGFLGCGYLGPGTLHRLLSS